MLLIVLTLVVTSSPCNPSPRVTACESLPFLYESPMATPSNFNSQAYEKSALRFFFIRESNSVNSSMLYVFPNDNIGYLWVTVLNFLVISPPTLWVGESGLTRSGNCFSRYSSSLMSISNSKSLIRGSSST